MSDRMTPMSAARLLDWMLDEYEDKGMICGVNKLFTASPEKKLDFLGGKLETPFGPAAGPHTQLTENLMASYAGGARFFELKTVQKIDGEDLPVNKPCILAEDECYNCEWSTELRVPQALDEYVKGWFIIKLMAREYGLGDPDGFQFNMSVGYDYEGVTGKKVDDYIEGMRDARNLPVWEECRKAAAERLPRFKNVDQAYIDAIDPRVSDSITLSTLHGCPPDEIERIATYLIEEKGMNTFIKCNPTLLGYETARSILDNLGFDYIVFDDHHFKEDLQYSDAVPMLRRLQERADKKGVAFGVKITNTFPVDVDARQLPSEEMYMSGRALYPLSITVAKNLSHDFDGKLRISLSGGADAFNIREICETGVWPVTVATTLLKAGGYDRLKQMAEELSQMNYAPWSGISVSALDDLQDQAVHGDRYRKPIKPLPSRKIGRRVPLLDCFTAPCSHGCPIHQDIPAYIGLCGEEKYAEALRVILDKNPLPAITGTICSHHCMDKCTRNFYEESVRIRNVKLQAATQGLDAVLETLRKPEPKGDPVAVVGGGAAGMAAAFFLARAGVPVTLFEKQERLGGIVRYVIPAFRIPDEVVERDVKLLEKMGVEVRTGQTAPPADELKKQGFADVILAIGAYKPGSVRLETGSSLNVLEFLEKFRAGTPQDLGRNVAIVGGGNTAMDAARAAKRAPGVENVYIVYRRTKRYMPADEEELQFAIDDGVKFIELVAPKSLENGKLTCTVMKLGEPDASGRRSPVPTDETTVLDVDTVIAAVGEKVESDVLEANGATVSKRGRALVDGDLMTTNAGVYVIGDAQRGPATVVEAIADARTATDAVLRKRDRAEFRYDDGREREKKGVLVTAGQALNEAQRCLECNIVCENCVDVCPNRANVSVEADGGAQIIHVDRLCNECGNCETFCPYDSAPYKDKFTLFSSQQDFNDSDNEGFWPQPDGKYLVRLDRSEFVSDGSGLPKGLANLMKAAAEKLAYFM